MPFRLGVPYYTVARISPSGDQITNRKTASGHIVGVVLGDKGQGMAVEPKRMSQAVEYPDTMSGAISVNAVMRVVAWQPSISFYPAQEVRDPGPARSSLTAILPSPPLGRARALREFSGHWRFLNAALARWSASRA